jgi:hypothetical protein
MKVYETRLDITGEERCASHFSEWDWAFTLDRTKEGVVRILDFKTKTPYGILTDNGFDIIIEHSGFGGIKAVKTQDGMDYFSFGSIVKGGKVSVILSGHATMKPIRQ